MIKVLHIVGARPQFIKLFPLHLEMKERGYNQKILHTGQHFDKNMSDVFFNEMGIPQPDFNLNIHSLSHGAMTGRMIEGIENIYQVLVSPKPKYPAFKSYLIYLKHKNCINIDDGKIKKSSKYITGSLVIEISSSLKFKKNSI